MGYTHSWRILAEPTADAWRAVCCDAAAILAAAPATAPEHYYGDHDAVPLILRGPLGDGAPELTPELIAFNGDAATPIAPGADTLARAARLGYDAATYPTVAADHESFYAPRAAGAQFCKTARKPYDLVAVAVLVALADRLGARVGSDGDAGDLADGVALWRRAVPGRTLPPGPWRA